MAKLLKLRFLDETDKENPSFVTLFMEGKLKGYKKRTPKDVITNMAEGTSCRTQKNLLLEARGVRAPWHQLSDRMFKGLLGEFNAHRTSLGWEAVELPIEEEDGN